MTVGSILWRRLDSPGHDACRLEQHGSGWQVEGTAVFRLDGRPARLTYAATCDVSWRARSGHIRGWIGDRTIEFSIERTAAGAWTLNGEDVPGLRDCMDLDFGFTPSTNLLQLRRLALDCGQAADAPAAWLDVSIRYARGSPPTLRTAIGDHILVRGSTLHLRGVSRSRSRGIRTEISWPLGSRGLMGRLAFAAMAWLCIGYSSAAGYEIEIGFE